MPGENLTRREAQERRAIINTSHYEIEIDLTIGEKTFFTRATVQFTAQPGTSTFIDAITDTVHSVTLNGVEQDPRTVSDGSRISLTNLGAENTLTIVATFAYTNTGEGLHRFVDPADGEVYIYSQFEVPDSRRVFPVFEQPDLKAQFQFTITAPSHWQVVSNSPTPEPSVANETNTAVWTFEPTPRISSYITALIAGPYVVERSELTSTDGRTIPLGVFCRASLAQYLDANYIFEKTRQGFAFYEEKFNYPYPFKKYDQLFVPEFNAGAMENAGAVTFTETYVFRSKVSNAIKERRVVTILHELAHMWFGDLVTMKWWNDLWLNESFAEWASTLATAEATEWTNAWTTFTAMEKNWAYRQDQLPTTHPVVATINDLEDVQVNFDGITYAKGASVLKQLVAWVGIDAFFSGLSTYFAQHKYNNTELTDLLRELEHASNRNLTEWSQLWLETAGVNTLRPEIETTPQRIITKFEVVQLAPTDHPTIRPHRLAIGFYTKTENNSLVRTHRVELDIDGERTQVPELIGLPRPDLVLLNDDDLTYTKIRLDPRSLRVAMADLAQIENPLARSLVWAAVWDSTRDAEIPARDFVQLVVNNIVHETESTTLRTVLNQLILTATQYVAPEQREATIYEVGETLKKLAHTAEPGSDAQFQFLKFFCTIASTPEHFQTLRELYEGTIELPGLTIDTDLTWELLIALAAGGIITHTDINAVLAADNTANGAQYAAQARAALPTQDSKRAAWNSVFTADTAPNAIVRHTSLGFQRVIDPSILSEFVDDYFASLEMIWKTRTYKIAEYLVQGFYPTPLANAQLREATQAWLNTSNPPPALRRLVVENLADVERACAAQERDARSSRLNFT